MPGEEEVGGIVCDFFVLLPIRTLANYMQSWVSGLTKMIAVVLLH